jgi:hypothetical protein
MFPKFCCLEQNWTMDTIKCQTTYKLVVSFSAGGKVDAIVFLWILSVVEGTSVDLLTLNTPSLPLIYRASHRRMRFLHSSHEAIGSRGVGARLRYQGWRNHDHKHQQRKSGLQWNSKFQTSSLVFTCLTKLDVMTERRRSKQNLNSSTFLENITVVLEMRHYVRTESTSPLSLHSLCFCERIRSMVRLRVG